MTYLLQINHELNAIFFFIVYVPNIQNNMIKNMFVFLLFPHGVPILDNGCNNSRASVTEVKV